MAPSRRSQAATKRGNVLFAGRLAWKDVPPSRPTGLGQWMLTYTRRGHALYRHPPQTEFLAEAGELVLLRRDTPGVRGAPGGEWQALWLRFDPWPGWTPRGFKRVAEGLYRRHVPLAGPRQALEAAWERIIFDLQARDTARALDTMVDAERDGRANDERIRTELLLLHLREIFLIAELHPVRATHLDARIRDAIEHMSADPASSYTVPGLARRAGLSRDWFGRLFASAVGVSPKRMLRVIRLRQAAVQLQFTEDPVGLIAERVGFSSIFDLSREFRREYGESPRTYRARHR